MIRVAGSAMVYQVDRVVIDLQIKMAEKILGKEVVKNCLTDHGIPFVEEDDAVTK